MQLTKKIMTDDVITIGAKAPVEEAYLTFHRHGIRHLPVTHKGQVVGILSDRDIQSTWDATLLVEDVMSAPALTILPTTTAAEAATLMRDNKVSSLLVADQGALRGIITTHDLLRVLEDMGQREKAGLIEGLTSKVRGWTHSTSVVDILAALSSSGI